MHSDSVLSFSSRSTTHRKSEKKVLGSPPRRVNFWGPNHTNFRQFLKKIFHFLSKNCLGDFRVTSLLTLGDFLLIPSGRSVLKQLIATQEEEVIIARTGYLKVEQSA